MNFPYQKIVAISLDIKSEDSLNPISTNEDFNWNTYHWCKSTDGDTWLYDIGRKKYYYIPREIYMQWAWRKLSLFEILKSFTDYAPLITS